MILFLITSFKFLFGAIIGSFLNVVIYRLPLGQNIVYPRSKCPGCDKLIKWYQNFPIISFIFLKGKCENCQSKISWRYPFVELLAGLLAIFIFDLVNIPKELFYFNLACCFICIYFIDIDHHIIPDKINLYLLFLVGLFSFLNLPIYHVVSGGIIGFLGPLTITWLFYKLRNQVGLGGGDIKLFGILGLYLGPLGIMHNIFMSSFIGAIIGAILIMMNKTDKNKPFAFGPYIIAVASFQIYFPEFFDRINPFSF